ncbi:MAG: flagellar export chaperone FliS [Phycisphaeraceae bacterium]|nr:flagellar export chaperone FliS [Phycisphaeraceae bacterium]
MSNAAANPYLKTKIMTSSPQELRLMLYEGAIKFTHQSVNAIEASDFEVSYNGLMRAQKIVLELSTSMNFNIAPELCDKLSALYTYIYRLLVEANMQRVVKPAREALELLEYERETWIMLMQNVDQGKVRNKPSRHCRSQRIPPVLRTVVSQTCPVASQLTLDPTSLRFFC